jgi:hypothetical protein
MSERWIPILAAVVGVLGGMGGAFIGGYVANEGQQERFDSERKAQVADSRLETYGNYLGELNKWIIVGGDGEAVTTAYGQVLLFSSSLALRQAARELGEAAEEINLAQKAQEEGEEISLTERNSLDEQYNTNLNDFISLAQKATGITE